MTENGPSIDLVAEAKADQSKIKELTKFHKESTGLTWLWSILLGCIYFWYHSFIARGFVVFFLFNFLFLMSLLPLMFIVTIPAWCIAVPLIAYSSWNRRAEEKAAAAMADSKLRS